LVRLSGSTDEGAQEQMIREFGGDEVAVALQLYRLYRSQGEQDKADAELAKAEALDPNAPAVLETLFQVAIDRGNRDEANRLIDRLMKLPADQRPGFAVDESML